jgi:hypothetical protein
MSTVSFTPLDKGEAGEKTCVKHAGCLSESIPNDIAISRATRNAVNRQPSGAVAC